MMDEAPPTLPSAPANAGRHAEWIAGRVQTLLSHYFSPELSPEVREAAIDDWIKALVDQGRDDIEDACQTYLRDQPRCRPTPGDIRQRALSRAGARLKNRRMALPPPEEPKPAPVSAEQAERICQMAGFTPKAIEALRRAPMARTLEEAMAPRLSTRRPHWTETVAPDSPEMEALRKARAANRLIGGDE